MCNILNQSRNYLKFGSKNNYFIKILPKKNIFHNPIRAFKRTIVNVPPSNGSVAFSPKPLSNECIIEPALHKVQLKWSRVAVSFDFRKGNAIVRNTKCEIPLVKMRKCVWRVACVGYANLCWGFFTIYVFLIFIIRNVECFIVSNVLFASLFFTASIRVYLFFKLQFKV